MERHGSPLQIRCGKFLAALGLLILLAAGLSASGGHAEAAALDPKSPTVAGTQAAAEPAKADRLVVEAKQLTYDRDKNVVTAEGNVQLYYQGRILEADKVTYDRTSSRVFATGNAKLTETDGTVAYGDRFDLTDDFKSGFIDSLSAITKDKTYFTAPRGERSAGETAVFDKGTYTACAPCKEHPERPPLWQLKAMKIIHNKEEKMIYFEDASFEFLGVPIAYLPYLSTPDPTVTRKTGFLAPGYVYESRLGFGASVPYFFNLAPNYDLTVTPTFLSKQGVLGQVEWRQRMMSGSYNIRATGIDQLDPGQFDAQPYGTGRRELRGSIETAGKFFINEQWKYGWDLSLFSDKYFFQDYKIRSESLTTDYIKESISTVYLTGQGDRSYFDLRGYRIQGLSEYDFNKQQPLVLPVLDYNRTIGLAPEKTYGVGGEVKIDLNFTAISRTAADYQSTGVRLLDKAFALYDVCPTSLTPNPALPNFKPPNCFIRGVGGDYDRASAQVSWQRKFIDPFGEVWTPFAFVRVDTSWLALNKSDTFTFTSAGGFSEISNADQSNFFGSKNDSFYGRAMPGIGLEYRYPFVASTGWATHLFEPIAQIVARPSELHAGDLPNEDAQSLVFDDTTLFEWNKFSGYDRTEGGVRANVGGQYTMTFNSGMSVNALFGQSFQVAGLNSYAISDVANVSAESGLATARSDYVGRVAVNLNQDFSFIARSRFSEKDFTPESIDVIANAKFGATTGSIQYSRYAAQTLIGYPYRREGILFSGRYDFLDHYFLKGSATIDLNPYKYDTATGLYDLKLGSPALSVLGLGVGYNDDCTTVSVNYSRSYTDSAGVRGLDQTVLLQLTLRTLAQGKVQTGVGGAQTVQDGIYK
ncbi:LPS-assembly protein LptD [Lichenihabitans psoromatis]|uniref:LPS-assembly protein LptD n=1 Tax=Lichenihabitans psoromatis TaxID=2528642 RepID=UPI0010365305|nr:LPS-assembly protein LptD [Lichenihabitans psoromatis]